MERPKGLFDPIDLSFLKAPIEITEEGIKAETVGEKLRMGEGLCI